MANAIELAKSYVPLLDEVYARELLTSDLDGAPELVQQGANANELIIPMMDMQGLADYSRNSGYVQGDVTLKNETVKCNFDRGRMFWVDSMDDLETAGIAFGRLAHEGRPGDRRLPVCDLLLQDRHRQEGGDPGRWRGRGCCAARRHHRHG